MTSGAVDTYIAAQPPAFAAALKIRR